MVRSPASLRSTTYHANQCHCAHAVRHDEEWCGKGLFRDAAARTLFANTLVILEVVLFAHRAERARVPNFASRIEPAQAKLLRVALEGARSVCTSDVGYFTSEPLVLILS